MGTPEAQIPSLRQSGKYREQDKLPRIDNSTNLKEVYSQLSRMGTSGFILSVQGKERGYVNASELARVVVAKANGDAAILRDYSAQSIALLISQFEFPLIPVRNAAAETPESELQNTDDTVFRIEETDGKVSGWYLNHEDVLRTATTKTVFLCTKGHPNPDSDHGTCYRCPFPIVGIATT